MVMHNCSGSDPGPFSPPPGGYHLPTQEEVHHGLAEAAKGSMWYAVAIERVRAGDKPKAAAHYADEFVRLYAERAVTPAKTYFGKDKPAGV